MIIKIQIRINSDSQQFYIIFAYNFASAQIKRKIVPMTIA